jgi:non-specific serine/threonine protein kinase
LPLRFASLLPQAPGEALWLLVTEALSTSLPEPVAFLRSLARLFLEQLCARPDLDEAPLSSEVSPPRESLRSLLDQLPPFEGAEYVDLDLLQRLWGDLARAAVALDPSLPSFGALLDAHAPLWRRVGRVTFVLAENRRNPAAPFAFLATFSHQLSDRGTVQQLPLLRALELYGASGDKGRLVRLLAPLERAAEASPLVRQLVDGHTVFHPLAFGPKEALALLRDTPEIERAGVRVKVPDWWRARPRPVVQARLGSKAPGSIGAEGLLDFSVSVVLGGEPLSEEELEELLRSQEGLVMLRGRWVEVDRERLEQALKHWKDAEKMARAGLSFGEAMRLAMGLGSGELTEQPEELRAWSRVEAGPWLQQALERMRAPERLEGGRLEGFQGELRGYQEQGARWLDFLGELGLGACLADDMGLGKTVQIIAAMLLRRGRRPGEVHLVVSPSSLLGNWSAELARFAPGLRVRVAHASAKGDAPGEADVVLTSYGMLARLPWVRERRWGLVVLDEAQHIKNPGSRQSKLARALQGEARVVVTGTPVENRPEDLWALFDFLNPGLLGTQRSFAAYARKSARGEASLARVRGLVRPYLLRRRKGDPAIAADLPEKIELPVWCLLSKRQAALYQREVDGLREAMQEADELRRRGAILASMTRLKQLCDHPSLVANDGGFDPQESGKWLRLGALCEEIAQRQERALIFTQFRELIGPLGSFLTRCFGAPGLALHGGTPVGQRKGLVDRFQREDGPPFFVISLRAGGVGLTLTAASHVIHLDRWWNPAVEDQATDRAHRIGQRRSVLVHKMMCRGTLDERIDAMIRSKKQIAQELLQGDLGPAITELSDQEILDLVALDLDAVSDDP